MAILEDRSAEEERDLAQLEIGALMDAAGVGVMIWLLAGTLMLAGCSLAPKTVLPTPPVAQSWPLGDAYLLQSAPQIGVRHARRLVGTAGLLFETRR